MKFYLTTQNQYDSDFIADFGTLPYNEEEEPLFLNPDGVRKRFPIGWNGHGRYIPGTLKVFKGDSQIDPDNIKQEYGGIFFEFATAPEKGSHTDYKVKYIPRPSDVAFSTGAKGSKYEGEEYFLFPNWLNAAGEDEAFWIGKYTLSRADASVTSQGSSSTPVTKKGVRTWTNYAYSGWDAVCNSKGPGFHRMRNREWMSIVYWQEAMGIAPDGNKFGNSNAANMDGKGNGYPSSSTIKAEDYNKILTGTGPASWRHNGKDGGISDLVGNVWEAVSGLKLINNIIWLFNDKNELYNTGFIYTSQMTLANATAFSRLRTDNPYYIEGIPTTLTDESLSRAVEGADGQWFYTSGERILYRGGSCYYGELCGLFTFSVSDDPSNSNWNSGCRLARELQDTIL